MRSYYLYDFSIGTLRIATLEDAIVEISIVSGRKAHSEGEEKETILVQEAYKELKEYFEGTRRSFDLPLAPQGTMFQKRVWKALLDIPYGETRSYKQIAEVVGSPKGFRAVGLANNKNPIIIVVPCHRVIGADGSLVGYGGGLEVKDQLLRLEHTYLTGQQELL
ncbi:methylated-DNA--[protein]-cysteine S-methyltransferase [Sediminispirochaeta smaragdinae]|uniref:Methylated-DNA--protein-cysteine methyltransferase n=1 Tax=Sediminispirochaeta smaragdinae (strain DSM 11293 / JCM 15392 / SEBR 4228) TaxID=573413 RepID=E1R3Y0_SEDSS|nr:methylated-DNA--[protein]-cysteine S-methyltransferase [Sediminispirochaeta smaragdinae]ADK82101.1 methylated-DNA/protein-cysteinemethyltransferase [Sediminispirochaeta smaragdinae DSM 11293]